MTWREHVQPLMDRFHELGARMTWEGYVSLNTDRPQKKDIILQHWYTNNTVLRFYIVLIYTNGSGWEVYSPVTNDISIKTTLEAIR
jgi:hypothetical protein